MFFVLTNMDYKEVYTKAKAFKEKLNSYVVKNGQMGDSYHIADRWITDILEKSFYVDCVLTDLNSYLVNPHTLTLKQLLSHVNYNDNKLSHFNAMCLIDTVSIK